MMTQSNLSYQNDPDALLTEKQAAEFLQISTRTLQAWRVRGGGPKIVKCGRCVRYKRAHLTGWMDNNTITSTSAELGK